MKNIALIGMAGSGKTTVGKELAGRMGYGFLDADGYIEQKEGSKLQDIIDKSGEKEFMKIEEKRIMELNLKKHVISVGGSAVLSEKAMKHLKTSSIVVFLDAPFEAIRKRINDMDTRGLVRLDAKDLRELFNFRLPLYRRYADAIVKVSDEPVKATVRKVLSEIRELR